MFGDDCRPLIAEFVFLYQVPQIKKENLDCMAWKLELKQIARFGEYIWFKT